MVRSDDELTFLDAESNFRLQAADRGAFIDQSQSLNIHLQSPTMAQLTSMHFYGVRIPSLVGAAG